MALKIYEISPDELSEAKYATIITNKGAMHFELFGSEAPQNVMNFATLAKEGFYKGLTFHRVIPNFVAQGGCPIGNGCGGPGYSIKCEVENNPHKHTKGALSMAHAGRDTGGSQFFICFTSLPHLDGEHTVFGQIIDKSSLEVLDNIRGDDVIEDVVISSQKPC